MSEEIERGGSGSEGNIVGIDPIAVALALDGASREKADAFLDDQRSLIAAQFARAARFDLTPSGESVLARHP